MTGFGPGGLAERPEGPGGPAGQQGQDAPARPAKGHGRQRKSGRVVGLARRLRARLRGPQGRHDAQGPL